MILQTLHLQSFRAHADTRVEFGPKVNLIWGANGAGKTNLLEAVHYLCLTKSFIASKDGYVLRKGAPFFEVEGTFTGEQRSELTVRLAYVPDTGKRVFLNGSPLDRLSEVVGKVPVVAFAPTDQAITAGGPDERRKLLNNILSQARPVYLEDMLKYRRALKQRNTLMMLFRKTRQRKGAGLEAWTEELISLGSRIVESRLRFIHGFQEFLDRAYRQIETVSEKPSIEYATVASFSRQTTISDITAAFRARLKRVADRELDQGRTLAGPHLDELIFRLNNLEVRRYASQGQHRTFGMALKLATYYYLCERLEEHPILLLDDVFGDLDARRSAVFMDLLQSDAVGQSLITAAEKTAFGTFVDFERQENRAIEVKSGHVASLTEISTK